MTIAVEIRGTQERRLNSIIVGIRGLLGLLSMVIPPAPFKVMTNLLDGRHIKTLFSMRAIFDHQHTPIFRLSCNCLVLYREASSLLEAY